MSKLDYVFLLLTPANKVHVGIPDGAVACGYGRTVQIMALMDPGDVPVATTCPECIKALDEIEREGVTG